MESATLVPGNSLITATPDEGRHLAVKLARLTVKLTQPDDARRGAARGLRERCRHASSASPMSWPSSSQPSPQRMVTGLRNGSSARDKPPADGTSDLRRP